MRKIQIQTTMKYHYTYVRMVKVKKKIVTSNAGKDAEKLNHSYIIFENVKWSNHSEKVRQFFNKMKHVITI